MIKWVLPLNNPPNNDVNPILKLLIFPVNYTRGVTNTNIALICSNDLHVFPLRVKLFVQLVQ